MRNQRVLIVEAEVEEVPIIEDLLLMAILLTQKAQRVRRNHQRNK